MMPPAWLVTAVVTRPGADAHLGSRPLLVRGTFTQRESCTQFLHLLRMLSREVVATITPIVPESGAGRDDLDGHRIGQIDAVVHASSSHPWARFEGGAAPGDPTAVRTEAGSVALPPVRAPLALPSRVR